MRLEKNRASKIRAVSQIIYPSSAEPVSDPPPADAQRSPPPYFGPHIIGDKNMIHPVPHPPSSQNDDGAAISLRLQEARLEDSEGEDIRSSTQTKNGQYYPDLEAEIYGIELLMLNSYYYF